MSEYEGVRAWECPNCSALISVMIIGDPPETNTLVRCQECGELVSLSQSGRWFPEAEAQALLDIQCAVAIADITTARVGYQRWCDARKETNGA